MAIFAQHSELLDSLTLFDRPDRERLRNFLPRGTDVAELVDELFLPVLQDGR